MLVINGADSGCINPLYMELFTINCSSVRRELFKRGILQVVNDNGWYSLWYNKTRFINGWLAGDINSARQIIDAACNTLKAIYMSGNEWDKSFIERDI